jgi:hypothetical protein
MHVSHFRKARSTFNECHHRRRRLSGIEASPGVGKEKPGNFNEVLSHI